MTRIKEEKQQLNKDWDYIHPRVEKKIRLETRNEEIKKIIKQLEDERYQNILKCRSLEIELKQKHCEIKVKQLLKKLYQLKLEELKGNWIYCKDYVVALNKTFNETKSPEIESKLADKIEIMTNVLEPQIEKIVKKTGIYVGDWFLSSKTIDVGILRKK
jgi:FMN phosphatase YigB (HAD superfamily)